MVVLVGILLAIIISCSNKSQVDFRSANPADTFSEDMAGDDVDVVEEKVMIKHYTQGGTISYRSLDILLIVDSSESMSNVRNGLSVRLGILLDQIEDSDWRLAITTTNAHYCLLNNWIITKMPNENFTREKEDFSKIISSGSKEELCGEICNFQLSTDSSKKDDQSDLSALSSYRVTSVDFVDYHVNERPILMAINGLGGDKTLAEDKCFAMDVYCWHRERHYQENRDDYLKIYGSEQSCLVEFCCRVFQPSAAPP